MQNKGPRSISSLEIQLVHIERGGPVIEVSSLRGSTELVSVSLSLSPHLMMERGPVSESLCFQCLEFRAMDKAQKPVYYEYRKPPSEPFRLLNIHRFGTRSAAIRGLLKGPTE
jgi:hypothetical protein